MMTNKNKMAHQQSNETCRNALCPIQTLKIKQSTPRANPAVKDETRKARRNRLF